MKAIVTGGAGFIGAAILDQLIHLKGAEIIAVIHKKPLADRHKNLEQWTGGVSAITNKRLADFQPDFIFHLARPTIPKWRKIGRILAGYQGAALNKALIQRMAKNASKCKLVYLSGSLMYGESKSDYPHLEKSQIRPISYARQYIHSEIPILNSLQNPMSKHLVIRVPWVLGDGSWFKWIYEQHFKRTKRIPLFGNGENMMQFITLESVAKTTIQMAQHGDTFGIRNLFGQVKHTQLEFANVIASTLKCELDTSTDHYEDAIQEAFRANLVLGSDFDFQSEPEELFRQRLLELTQRFLENE